MDEEVENESLASSPKPRSGVFAGVGLFLIVSGVALLAGRAIAGEFESLGAAANAMLIVLGAAMLWKPLRDRARTKKKQQAR